MANAPPDPGQSVDRWFHVVENDQTTLITIDESPTRDDHVTTLASRLNALADTSRGRLTLDLSAVKLYSWPWTRALLDLSARCEALGGQLAIHGMTEQGRKQLNANRTMLKPLRSRAAPRDAPALKDGDGLLPLGGQSQHPPISAASRRFIRSAA